MTLSEQPKSMVVLGAGAIGVEFASFYRALGTEVTIVEFMPRLVPNEDPEISKELMRAFDKRGIKSLLDHKLTSAKNEGGKVVMTVEPKAAPGAPSRDSAEAAKTIEADILLVAVGIAANTENIGLEAHGVVLEKGFIKVDAENKCGEDLYAIGDVIGRGLAHVASAEGVFVAEKIAGVHAEPVRYDAIPACTYCSPEIASVGLTEEKAKAKGLKFSASVNDMRDWFSGRTYAESVAWAKVLVEEGGGRILGASSTCS
jgi:dihydrolipoamide dehydrogenase